MRVTFFIIPLRPFLAGLRKGDRSKVICAALAKRHNAVGNEWLGKRLAMGHSAYVNSLVNRMRKNPNDLKILGKYENLLLKCKDPNYIIGMTSPSKAQV